MMDKRAARGIFERSEELIELIRPILSGQGPEVQGATIASLMATFVASHAPELRWEQLEILAEYARKLVPVEVEIMIERGVVPVAWRDPPDQPNSTARRGRARRG